MQSALDFTKMTDFVINNNYQWHYLYFRALTASRDYSDYLSQCDSEATNDIAELATITQYWGDLSQLILDEDYDYYADYFEQWINDTKSKLTLDPISNIQIAHQGADTPHANTLYLKVANDKNLDVLAHRYKDELVSIMSKANELIAKSIFLPKITKGKTNAKLEQYERWIDAALLTEIEGYGEGSHDTFSIYLHIITSEKPCWRRFKATYDFYGLCGKRLSDFAVVDNPTSPEDYSTDDIKRVDFNDALRNIDKLIAQGKGCISQIKHNVLKGIR
ncbi:hypothetical protein [Nitrincola sp.]|uniref:hypothetical protein n=1 Tax=Nitrincola sp. TaxID=1926584 RepID=UPI003A93F292